LLTQHVSTGFESPAIAEYDPVARGPLPPDFSGTAYDAVLLGDTPGKEDGLSWLRDLSRRNGSPPVIYLTRNVTAEAEEAATAAGAHACLSGRKIDHARLIAALRGAQAGRGSTPVPAPRPEDEPRTGRFGEANIRGFRFVSQIAENAVSSVYLARSERTGEEVVLKVLRQPPDGGSEAKTFDRFLREYQIAAGYRIYNLGNNQIVELSRLVSLIEKACGVSAKINREPNQPGDVRLTCADITRAGDDLGYNPSVPIEEGVERFVDWYRRNLVTP
jgi:CheY-like chemotaxis protein